MPDGLNSPVVPTNDLVMAGEQPATPSSGGQIQRFAVVVHPRLEAGEAASAAATVVGGLQSDGFAPPVLDADNHAHSGIRWSLVVLRAKSTNQLVTLLAAAGGRSVRAVAFTRFGQRLNNQFAHYSEQITRSRTTDLEVIAVGLFGPDADVRELTPSPC